MISLCMSLMDSNEDIHSVTSIWHRHVCGGGRLVPREITHNWHGLTAVLNAVSH